MIIALEGFDGAGKNSVAEALRSWCGARVLEFPATGTITNQIIREFLNGEWRVEYSEPEDGNPQAGALVHQALQIVNRLEKTEMLKNAKAAAHDLVLVRYWQSGIAYGTGADGLDERALLEISKHLVPADVNILLDIDPQTAAARRTMRGKPADEYEARASVHEKVIDKYRELWRARQKRKGETRWPIVDATQPPMQVAIEVVRAVEKCRNYQCGVGEKQ